jgi:hypothetical protein
VLPNPTNLPNIDQKKTKLLNRPPTILLRPRRPKLATESIRHQEQHLRYTSNLFADMVFLADMGDAMGVDGSVEIHANLDEEDDDENLPLAPGREGVTQLIPGISILKLDLVAFDDPTAVLVTDLGALAKVGIAFGLGDRLHGRRVVPRELGGDGGWRWRSRSDRKKETKRSRHAQ